MKLWAATAIVVAGLAFSAAWTCGMAVLLWERFVQ